MNLNRAAEPLTWRRIMMPASQTKAASNGKKGSTRLLLESLGFVKISPENLETHSKSAMLKLQKPASYSRGQPDATNELPRWMHTVGTYS